MTTWFQRYVALGDSQTEGLNDGDDTVGFRGWADRFADQLAEVNPDVLYANLAVRGCRAAHVRHTQLDAALALRPDLATVVVGMNDLLRHDYDLDKTIQEVEETFAALVGAGATVATMSFPDLGRMLPVMRWLRAKEKVLNDRLREAAGRHGVLVLELFDKEMCGDPQMWSGDRIHGSAEGHARIAAGMAEVFGLPGAGGAWAAPAGRASNNLLHVVRRDAWWAATFVVPFLTRQLTGRSTGRDRTGKRPQLLPVREPLADTATAAPPA